MQKVSFEQISRFRLDIQRIRISVSYTPRKAFSRELDYQRTSQQRASIIGSKIFFSFGKGIFFLRNDKNKKYFYD